MPTSRLATAALLAAICASSAGAQFRTQVQTGDRVRVWLPEEYLQENGSPWHRQLLRGTLTGVDSGALRLTIPGATGSLVIPRTEIRRIDVSKGESRIASAFERAAMFAISGAVGAALENDPKSTEWPHYNRTWRAAEEGAKWGAAIGAVVGFVLPTERWRRARLSR
jgi:hypothetical protein